jgi:hypothetical protein
MAIADVFHGFGRMHPVGFSASADDPRSRFKGKTNSPKLPLTEKDPESVIKADVRLVVLQLITFKAACPEFKGV